MVVGGQYKSFVLSKLAFPLISWSTFLFISLACQGRQTKLLKYNSCQSLQPYFPEPKQYSAKYFKGLGLVLQPKKTQGKNYAQSKGD